MFGLRVWLFVVLLFVLSLCKASELSRWNTTTLFGYSGDQEKGRQQHIAVAISTSTVFIFGGSPLSEFEDCDDTAIIYNIELHQWKQTTPSRNPRAGHAAVAYENNVYVFGGVDVDGVPTSSVQIYNQPTATWRLEAGPSGVARSGHSAVLLPKSGEMLIFGGEGVPSAGAQPPVYDDVLSLNLESLAWQVVKTREGAASADGGLGSSGRTQHAAVLVDGLGLFIHGGLDSNRNALSTIALFDIEGSEWVQLRHIGGQATPKGRFGHSGVYWAARHSLVFYGGRTADQLHCTTCYSNDVLIYDIAMHVWVSSDTVGAAHTITAGIGRAGHTATPLQSSSSSSSSSSGGSEQRILMYGGWSSVRNASLELLVIPHANDSLATRLGGASMLSREVRDAMANTTYSGSSTTSTTGSVFTTTTTAATTGGANQQTSGGGGGGHGSSVGPIVGAIIAVLVVGGLIAAAFVWYKKHKGSQNPDFLSIELGAPGGAAVGGAAAVGAGSRTFSSVTAVGVAADQNKKYRRAMEDMHAMVDGYGGSQRQGLFVVCDGHGGADASEFVAQHLAQALADEILEDGDASAGDPNNVPPFQGAFRRCDQQLKGQLRGNSGATALAVLVRTTGDGKWLYTANVGDTRAVLAHNRKAQRLSRDHRANDEQEVARITKLGGFMLGGKVGGVLEVTRSLGDFEIKHFVTCDPYTKATQLEQKDSHIILATDGLWDVVSDQEAVDCIVQSNMQNDAQGLAERLVQLALERGSKDNVTVMVIVP